METYAPFDLPLPPGSSGFPIVGETGDWARDPLGFAQTRYERYGPVFRTHLLGRPCVVLLGPEANRFMLSSHLHLFSSRRGWSKTITTLLGDGLSMIDGIEHRRHRSLIMPTLHASAIPRFFAVMDAMIREQLAAWPKADEQQLAHGFKELSFAIALRLIVGIEGEAALRKIIRPFETFTRGLFAPPAWKIRGLPYGNAWYAGQRLRQALLAEVHAQRAAPRDTVLSMLIAARDSEGNPLSDNELVDEMLVLLWAGHDTITSLLTWVWYELLHHPTVLGALEVEQELVLGGEALAVEHLKHFPLMDRVLRETERLHPPAPGGFRGVLSSFEYNGFHIPAGWTVMYSSVFTHHMPALWADPERFDPERFAPPRSEGHKPFHLIGFGGGPRICVGFAFAQMQMRMVLAHMLRTLDLQLVAGQNFRSVSVPTAMPKDGMRVRIRAK